MTLQEKALNKLTRKQGKIVAWADHGRHIPLKCKIHPQFTFNTKNIDYIGARPVFGSGCDCSIGLLEPVVPDDLNSRQLFLDFATGWIQARKHRIEKETKLAKLGFTSGIRWIVDQRKKTGKSLDILKDEAYAMGIL